MSSVRWCATSCPTSTTNPWGQSPRESFDRGTIETARRFRPEMTHARKGFAWTLTPTEPIDFRLDARRLCAIAHADEPRMVADGVEQRRGHVEPQPRVSLIRPLEHLKTAFRLPRADERGGNVERICRREPVRVGELAERVVGPTPGAHRIAA